MTDLKVITSSISEAVTTAEIKTMLGYPSAETTQDSLISSLIVTAREWLELRTGKSFISKSYQAYFEKEDADEDGWYELPMSPVLASPAITVSVCGVSTTFQQKGLNRVWIRPDNVYGTIPIGSSSQVYYVTATFQAGATNNTASDCIRRIVTHLFMHRDDGMNVSFARLPFDTQTLIKSLEL